MTGQQDVLKITYLANICRASYPVDMQQRETEPRKIRLPMHSSSVRGQHWEMNGGHCGLVWDSWDICDSRVTRLTESDLNIKPGWTLNRN
jgi:hypothetical protein